MSRATKAGQPTGAGQERFNPDSQRLAKTSTTASVIEDKSPTSRGWGRCLASGADDLLAPHVARSSGMNLESDCRGTWSARSQWESPGEI